MPKEKIPLYHLYNLVTLPLAPGEFMIESFGPYLGRQSPHLHHAHRHVFYHLVCFTGGSGSHSIDFTRFPVEAGQIYFMAPGQVHSWNFEGQPEGYVINFSVDFLRQFLLNPNFLDRFNFFSGRAEDSVCSLSGLLKDKDYSLLEDMLANQADGNGDMLRVQLLELFLLVQGASSGGAGVAGGAADGSSGAGGSGQKQALLAHLRRLIEQHYKTLRRPGEYAELLHITPNHLNALCQEMLGRPAGEVIRDRVLLEAKRLLTNADMTAAEIAYELNFDDNSYFSRFFKKYEGVTPDEFRRRHLVK